MHRFLFLLGALLAQFLTSVQAGVGWIDTEFPAITDGRTRVGFNLGSPFEYVREVRGLPDGRVMLLGVAASAVDRQVAVALRRSNGQRDTSIGLSGQYSFVPVGGLVDLFNSAFAIADDGSYYVVGLSGNELRVWRHALDGSLLAGPFALGVAARELKPDAALIDAQGRLLISGRIKPVGSGEALADAFVLRMLTDGSLDPVFGVRELSFNGAGRDDGYRLREVGNDGYLLCSRVGDLDGSLLGYGLARLSDDGSLHPEFNGGELLVHFLAVDGQSYDAACNDIGVLRTSTTTRFYVTGRASLAGQDARTFVRVHQEDGSVMPTFGEQGQVLLDFSTAGHIDGFPRIEIGQSADDIGRAYVVSDGVGVFFFPQVRGVVATRLNSLGSVDPTWGAMPGQTVVDFRVPDSAGELRSNGIQAIHLGPSGLVLGGYLRPDDTDFDWTLVRLTGYRSFRNGFE